MVCRRAGLAHGVAVREGVCPAKRGVNPFIVGVFVPTLENEPESEHFLPIVGVGTVVEEFPPCMIWSPSLSPVSIK